MTKTPKHKAKQPGERTLEAWASMGYAAKPGRDGETRWTNRLCQRTATFYREEDVEPDAERAAGILEQLREARLRKRREAREQARQERERNMETWRAVLSDTCRIVVFDTETSGLQPGRNVILSLSWQVLDSRLRRIEERTRFFEWPADPARVEDRAIDVNGLTPERLAELGTTDKAEALREFAEAVEGADILVAHNGKFDEAFILADAAELRTEIDMSAPLWDTMLHTTRLVGIRREGGYKWPRLSELADKLRIRQDDIDFHQSASDVEVTARCLRAIVGRGLLPWQPCSRVTTPTPTQQ